MADLNKVFADLEAVSKGDVGALSRATEEFARDVMTQTNAIPRDSSVPAKSPPAAPPQGPQSK